MPEQLMLALNQFTVRDLEFDEAARLTRAAGFDGLGVFRPTLDELGVATVSNVLVRHGLVPTSVCVAMGLTHPDRDARCELYKQAVAALRAATELAVPLVVVVGGPRRGLTLRDATAQAHDAMANLAAHAASIGGRILVEPLHPVLVAFSALTGLRQALHAIAGLPACAVVVDTWHVWSEPDLYDTLDSGIDAVGMVHLADWSADSDTPLDRALPGEGVADLPGLCRHLAISGYTGWWEVEVLSEQLWREDQRDLPSRCAAAAQRVLSGALTRPATPAVPAGEPDGLPEVRGSRGGDKHAEASS